MPLLRARTRPPARSELEQKNLVNLPGPAGLRPLPEVAAGEQSCLVIVGAEIRGARMRNVDRDERNVRFEVLRGDRRGHGLVGLKFDDEVDFLLDEMLGVAQRNLRLIAVIHDDQLEALTLGRPHQPGVHFAREGAVLTLGRVTDAEALVGANLDNETIMPFVDLLDEPALVERVQEPEAHALAVSGSLDDVAQAQHVAWRVERLENLRGVHQRLHDVRIAGFGRHRMCGIVEQTITCCPRLCDRPRRT